MLALGLIIIGISLILAAIKKPLNVDKKIYAIIFFILFIISVIFSLVFKGNSSLLGVIGSLWMYIAFAFVILHSSVSLGNKKTIIFLSITLLFGLVSELLGTAYGWVYGSYYYPGNQFFFGLVPLQTPISWAIIIYMSYSITNMFLKGFGCDKTNRNIPIISLVGLLLILSAVDGLIAMNLDMIMDPLAVAPEIAGWVWIGGGPYFGVPISNFIGWFFVTFITTLIFRFYESYSTSPKLDRSFSLYIPILYATYFLIHAVQSIQINHIEFVLIGVATMGPFLLLVLLMTFIINLKEKK